uniref:Uncharacterized protein n=1 Tax=Noctiluca scintillans TaxID=2966 RepID=A0A7S1AMF5_NOCSC
MAQVVPVVSELFSLASVFFPRMFHSRDFFIFACTLVYVESIRVTKRGELSGCHPMLDFKHVVQFWKLDGVHQDAFLQDLGCEVRSNPSSETTDLTCSDNAFACMGSVEDVSSNNYMCCNYKYSSRSGPELTTISGQTLSVWTTGPATLLQIPKFPETVPTVQVQVNVQPYAPYWYTMGCEGGRISEVVVSGTSVGESSLTIRSGALHAEEPFAVRLGDGPWHDVSWNTHVVDNETTLVSSPGVTVTGAIRAKDPEHWGPDASATVTAGGISIEVQQQTSGTGDVSRPMLDVSVHGTYSKSGGIGGLLSPDGVSLTQGMEPVPCMTIDSLGSA